MSRSDHLDPDKLSAGICFPRMGSKALVFDSISSTNYIAAEYSRNPSYHGLAVFAEYQSAGRGRAGNTWSSARGQSVLCSLVLVDCPIKTELFCLAGAVAVAEAIGAKACIKWPNDILLHGQKVAGLLVESKVWPTHQAYIFGFGINCHQRQADFPDAIRPTATSIDMQTGRVTDRTRLARRVMASVDHWLDAGQTCPEVIVEGWRKRSMQWDRHVVLRYRGRQFSGHCVGIDPEQGLILQLDHGGVRMFDAARSSIVKPDGPDR